MPSQTEPQNGASRLTRRATTLYALLGALWILLSDLAVDWLVSDRFSSGAQTAKDWLFIAVTALSLYLLLAHYARRVRRADLALLAERERFRDFAESASDWFWETDANHRFRFVTDCFRVLTGIDPAQIMAMTRADVMAPDVDPDIMHRHLDALAAHESFKDFVYPVIAADGKRRYFRVSGKPLFDVAGAFAGYRGIGCDITETVVAQEQTQRLAGIVEASPDFVASTEADGRLHYVNAAGRAMIGFAADEDVAHLRIDDLYPPAATGTVADRIRTARRDGVWAGESELASRSGRSIPVWQQVIAHPGMTSPALCLSIIATDLSERRRAAAALREREQQYRAIFEGASDALVIFDLEGRIVEVNPAGCVMFGYAHEDMVGRLGDALLHPDERYKMSEFIRTVRDGGIWHARTRTLNRDGTTTTVGISGSGFVYDSAPHMLAGIRDITERLALERRLAQSQKMEAIGQLTGGIAHDFNNLLLVSLGSAELLSEQLAADPKKRELAEAVLRSGRRAAELTRQLLAFARRQPLQPESISLNGLVGDMVPMLRRTLGETIGIDTRFAADLWPARADRAQVESCIVNLAINARDAMPNGGDLIVETRNVRLDAQPGPPQLAPGGYVVLSVTDTGSGMSPDVVVRAFDPFFTTKEPGKGSGLGLSMVYGFAQQSGGAATIYSEPGLGTTVRIYLPRQDTMPHGTSSHAPTDGVPTGDETVLVVEDAPEVCEFVVGQLRALGYSVLQAGSGPEALTLFEQHPEIDLLMTDVVMPGGMSGPQLADEARTRRPGIRVLFTSGYADPAVLARAQFDPGAPMLPKPYRRADLAHAVRDALDG